MRRHVVLDTLTTILTTDVGRRGRRARVFAALGGGSGRGGAARHRGALAVSSLLCVSTLPVLIDMFSSFLATTLEEADVAPQLEGLEQHEAPVAVEGANRAAAAAAR